MGSLDDSKSPNDMVVLNVGGTRFETTKQTLCTYPDSMLAKMMDPNSLFFQDDEAFIDRDPTCFASILNYLRMGSIAVAHENNKYRELLALEAEFYGLPLPAAMDDATEARIAAAEQHIVELHDMICEQELRHKWDQTIRDFRYFAFGGLKRRLVVITVTAVLAAVCYKQVRSG